MEHPNTVLAFRITETYVALTEVWDKIYEHCEKCVLVEHVKDAKVSRTHVHGLVVGLKVSVETIKNWIRMRNASVRWERGDWSFKTTYKHPTSKQSVPVNEAMLTYMMKGELSPCRLPKGYTMDEIRAYRAAWVAKPQIQKDLLDREVDNSKVTHWDMMRQVEDKLKLYQREVTDVDVIHEIIHVHKLNHKLISRYKVRDFVDTYQARNNERAFIEQIISLCRKV